MHKKFFLYINEFCRKSRKHRKDRKDEKRVLSETQLQVLKLAREKAMEKRKQLGDIKRKEKQLNKDKLSDRIKKIALEEGERERAKLRKKEKSTKR